MEVLIHADGSIHVRPDLERHVREVLESKLTRFGHRLTRVEVGFNDEKVRHVGVPDRRCTIEARPTGMDTVAVTANTGEFVLSFDAAAEKLMSALETRLGKAGEVKGAPSIRTALPE
ncbi:MAG: HPF/RaiA family ribosome-associated protein [Actinomycetota bacterium]|nr:HPF/RaiA family ribosome-associated protein [Actinomycetota bacterium]